MPVEVLARVVKKTSGPQAVSIVAPAPPQSRPTPITMDVLPKYRRIHDRLACPRCGSRLEIAAQVTLGGVALEGEIRCPRCAAPVGTVAAGKPDFIGHPRFGLWPADPVDLGPCTLVRRSTRRFESAPGWTVAADGDLFSEEVGAEYHLSTSAFAIQLAILKHPWSGSVSVVVDDFELGSVDLFEAEGSMVCRVPIFLGTDGTEHSIRVRVGRERNARSRGQQVWLKAIDVLEAQPGEPQLVVPIENRGNPYPGQFSELLKRVPADALVLDCGCGDRIYDDPRVVNFEYSPFGAPEVYGDGHALPFERDTFDLVLSQAVFEHVHDPFKAASEIFRVVKPGGELYCESAFMQPLHAVPYHFFNTTVWGIQKVFEAFEPIAISSDGSLSDTLTWIYSLTGLRQKGHGAKVDELLRLVRELDQHITRDELRKFSSFVTFHGRRRPSFSKDS